MATGGRKRPFCEIAAVVSEAASSTEVIRISVSRFGHEERPFTVAVPGAATVDDFKLSIYQHAGLKAAAQMLAFGEVALSEGCKRLAEESPRSDSPAPWRGRPHPPRTPQLHQTSQHAHLESPH